MDNLRRLGDSFSVPIQPDEGGFIGRECPEPACEGYFKIECGTGLKGKGLPCHCPYCGHTAGHDQFGTKEQIEYAKSVAMRKITDAIHKDLKQMEFESKPKGAFGIGFSLKVEPGRPVPIRYYREKQLETEVVCSSCTLHYSIYGVFAFCPDCGQHNSLQILDRNLQVVTKMLNLAATLDGALANALVDNALEDCVSSFDGYGREVCRIYAKDSAEPANAVNVSFQSLEGARKNVTRLFSVDLASGLDFDEWQTAIRLFQKRHLLSHKMGIVDNEYVRKSGDANSVPGRKVKIGSEDVRALIPVVAKLARHLGSELQGLAPVA
jgi:hypothetical protein